MKKRLLLIIVAVCSFTIVFAQKVEKFTPSTLQFISERNGEVQLPQTKQQVPVTFDPTSSIVDMQNDPLFSKNKKFSTNTRKIAEAEMVDGEQVISAFIGVKNNDFSGIEALGVTIQTKFNGLCVALIPVGQLEELSELDNVTKIEVAEILEVYNDKQREATQAGDAITNSAAAQALGLTKAYTGKNVILGIIDTGIDFQHLAFKDKNGNSRIVRAYKLSGSTSTSLTTYSSSSQISSLTYDTNSEDHGTHTSSTAGGSSVIVNGNNVTVTDDHANATYGGMAPEANLVIAGLSSLYTTAIATAIQNICNYADQQGKPCVISLSLGSQQGPHDGTGTVADVVNQCAGNNHIIVYAASNDAMRADYFVKAGTSNGGGCYASGTASNNKPLLANIQRSWTNADGNVQLYTSTIHAYARSANTAISLKFRVVDTTTGDVVYSSSAYSGSTTISMTGSSGLAQYFRSQSGNYNQYGDNATIRIVRGQDSNSGKYYFTIYTPVLVSTSYDDADGDGVYNSKYALCLSFYPSSGSTIVDMWESAGVNWFGNDLQLSNTYANSYTIANGNDECSVSDNATIAKAITVGAYVTKNSITDYAGTTHDWSEDYPNIGDHASFSSWQTAGYGPTGTALPYINAPGARIVAGINHYHTKSVDDYSYWSDDYISDLVVNNTNYAYAAMEGTSMATPCVSGIIAQWLEACVEAGKTPTPDYIKEVMAATWDTDQWTNGTGTGAHGANTFGTHGKINAIKGLQYILGVSAGPAITATPSTVTFDENSYATRTYTKAVNVKGVNLEGNVTASLSGNSSFSIDKTTITKNQATNGTDITITWSPTTAGTQTATITLSSTGADNVVVNINGTAKPAIPMIVAEPETLTFTAGLDQTQTNTIDVLSEFLTENITVTLSDANGVFSINKTSITKAESEEGATINVAFNSAEEGTYTGTVTLSSPGAETVTINLSATASEGGKASDAYLNIAKYATIDEAGWRTALVDKLYKYTEYENEEVAWLTLPVYGAFVGARYATNSSTVGSGHPQAWIECSLGTSNTYGGTTWTNTASATNPFTGSNVYFTSATARAIGYNSRNSNTLLSVSYYVTNVTAVKLYGQGQSRTSSSYPARLQVYECTENADGTLTTSSQTVKNLSDSNTSSYFTLTADGLDAEKIYKVVTSTYRSYLNEVAFQTPIEVTRIPELVVTPTDLTFTAPVGSSANGSFNIVGQNLNGPVTLTLNDANGVFSINETSVSAANAAEGVDINVTFNPETEGTYTATVTVATEGLDDQTVTITGTSTKGYVDLTVGKYGVATLYTDIPLQIPYDTFDDLLGVFYAYEFNIDNSEIRIKRISDNVPALCGVIVMANAGTYRFPIATANVDPIADNVLEGTLEAIPTNSIEGTVMTLGLGSNGYIGFYRYSGATLGAGKVYVVIPDEQVKTMGAMSIVVENEMNDATNINDIIDNGIETNDAWYTLQGLRLNGKPTTKGIYIHHGKTVIVK